MEAFSAGGFAAGPSSFSQNRSELADMLSLSRNRHMIKLGGRVRGLTQSDRSVQNYNGMFTFTSLDAYRITGLGLRDGLTPSQIRALGGGASQFSMVGGDPLARVGQVDAGVFLQDDWGPEQLRAAHWLRLGAGRPGPAAGAHGYPRRFRHVL
jgi:hypothetical protein